jgi:hypothetical protein
LFITNVFSMKWYAEVPPQFVEQYYNDLPKKCNILDIDGVYPTLTLNKDHIIPHLTDGWFSLLKHLNVEKPTQIICSYYGGGNFKITSGQVFSSTGQYPSFHSHSTKSNFTSYFDIILTQKSFLSEQLVLFISLIYL